jgi:hypothetical protein
MGLSEDKKREYDRIMASRGQRSPVTAIPDAFAEYSLTDFANEMSILEAAGAAWGVQFCPAATGFMNKAGGAWIAYSGHTPRSVIHAESFIGKSDAQKAINFWAEYLLRAKHMALLYHLPLTILVKFEDGVFSRKYDFITTPLVGGVDQLPIPTVGTRIAKGADYADCVNMVITVPMSEFKPTSRRT